MTVGIYAITNVQNGKAYVGSSANIERRYILHIQQLRRGQHNRKFQNAFNKYGEKSFVLSVLEECQKSDLIVREQHWIDQYTGRYYNISPFADRPPGWLGLHHTEETKRKIGESQKGKKLTDAHRALIKENWKIRRTIPVSQETRDRISRASKGSNNPMYGRTMYDAWFRKYGKDEADRKWSAWLDKRKTVMAHLRGDNNPSRRPEVRQKISRNRSGIKMPFKAVAWMRIYRKGRKASEETKRKLSDSRWGELNAASKFSNRERIEIQAKLSEGESPTKLAKLHNVSRRTIYNIRDFRSRIT